MIKTKQMQDLKMRSQRENDIQCFEKCINTGTLTLYIEMQRIFNTNRDSRV